LFDIIFVLESFAHRFSFLFFFFGCCCFVCLGQMQKNISD